MSKNEITETLFYARVRLPTSYNGIPYRERHEPYNGHEVAVIRVDGDDATCCVNTGAAAGRTVVLSLSRDLVLDLESV